MNTEATQIHRISRQSHAIPGWLTTDRLKRGALLYWAALFTLSAAIIHAIGVLEQPPQSGLLVALISGFAVIQLAIALAVVALPARRLLIATAVVEGAAVLLWIVAHTSGLPIGLTIWRPEMLAVTDLYLPAMEGLSAFFFLCLFGRTWTTAPRTWRIVLRMLPFLLLLGILIWAATHFGMAEIIVVIFVLAAGLPDSLQDLFLPAVGLLATFLVLRFVFPRLRTMTPRAWRTALILLPALLLVSILTWTGSYTAADRGWFPVPSTVSAPAGKLTSLTYCTSGGNPLVMDISEPSAQAARPAPMVFYIHGGEGLLGDRNLENAGAQGAYLIQLRDELLSRGFVVGSLDYDLAPIHHIADEVIEAKCAVRFLRAHTHELGIDPQRIGVYGDSEGGYISAMLGTAGPQAGFDTGQYLNQSSHVQAVVDMWGPIDLANFSGSPSWVHALGASLSGGGSPGGVRVRSNIPLTYIAPGDPPFLIIHGAEDWFIAPHHSQELARSLHAAGVPETLVIVQNDEHGLIAPTPGKVEQPDPATLIHMIRDFFVRTLAA